MIENNPVTVAEENKRLEENPIAPVNPPVTTATEVPTAPTVSVEANKETANVGGTAPVVSTPPVATPAPTDYKWDATTNSYKEVPKTETPAPSPTPTSKSTVAPPEAKAGTEAKPQEYYDQFKGRENEVLTNLNSAYSSGIKDAEGIKKFASYDTATPEKKAAIDAFIANKQKEELSAKEGSQFGSEEGIFGALNNNVMVPDSVKSSPAYKAAFDRYRKLKFLSGYSANDIAAILKNGKLVPGSRTYQDLYNTAIGKANIEKANKILNISGNAVDVTQAGKNLTQETLKENPTLSKALEDGEISIEEFKALTSSPELEAEAKVLAEKQLEIKKLQSERNKIRDDVDKKYGGFVTASERAQIVANRTRDINRTLEPLVLEYESAFGTYSEKKKEALSLFSTNYELYKEKKAEEAKKSAIEEQRTYEEEKEKRKNVYDSVSSQIKFALENGVDLKRTDANVVIADAKSYATANGVSLEEGIKKTFTEPLTSKPSYRAALQAIYDKNSGALTPYQKAQLAMEEKQLGLSAMKFQYEMGKPEWRQGDDGRWVNVNSSANPNQTVDVEGNPFMINNFTTTRNGSPEVTCGQLANDFVAEVGGWLVKARFWDSFESKVNAINQIGKSETPVIGWLFTFDPLKNGVGHVGIVSDVKPDGSIVVREANRKGTISGKSVAETNTYSPEQVANMKFSIAVPEAPYRKDEYVGNIIKSLWGLRLSNEEKKTIEERARKYYSAWLSKSQAMLRSAGLDVDNQPQAVQTAAVNLYALSRSLSDKNRKDEFASSISTKIKNGWIKEAQKYWEQLVDEEVKSLNGDSALLTPDRNTARSLNLELISLLRKNRDKIGLIEGTWNEVRSKFVADEDFTKIGSILQMMQAPERKYFAGSAVTAQEMDVLKKFIGGNEKFQVDNLITQLKTVEDRSENQYYNQRSNFGY